VEDYDQDNAITTLRPNKFRPQAGARNRVRSRLQEVLIEDENEEDVPSGRPRTPQSPIPSPTERYRTPSTFCMQKGRHIVNNTRDISRIFP